MDVARERERIYIAMVRAKGAVASLISRSPPELLQDLADVMASIDRLIDLLEGNVDPRSAENRPGFESR